MALAPINRFQHPVSPNFDECLFGTKQSNKSNDNDNNNNNNDSTSTLDTTSPTSELGTTTTTANSVLVTNVITTIPQKTEESERYIKEFLSKMRPELLKKRGMKNVVSIKKLMQQIQPTALSKKESFVAAMETMDIEDEEGNDNCNNVNDNSDNYLNTVNNGKIWMKLLQFCENHRPAYYGTNSIIRNFLLIKI